MSNTISFFSKMLAHNHLHPRYIFLLCRWLVNISKHHLYLKYFCNFEN